MLGHRIPEDDLVEAVRKRIAEGQAGLALEELARISPDGWEVVVTDTEPLPLCYSWLFGAIDPETDEEVFVVFRRKTPEQRKPAKGNQNSYW